MKLTRKPLAVIVSVLVCGVPPNVAWSNSNYSAGFGVKHRDGASMDSSPTNIAFDAADVIHNVELINHNTAQLKLRVRSLEFKLAKTLRQYQADLSEINRVKTYPISKAEHTDPIEKISYLSPVHWTPESMWDSFDLSVVQPELKIAKPELAIAKDESSIASEVVAVAMPQKNDAGLTETARPERREPVVDDNNAAPNDIVEPSIVGEALAMNDTTLSEMRGGFTTSSGLQVAFGIERAVYVNGALISTTSLNVLNLGNLTPNVPTAADLAANVHVPSAADITANVNVPTAAALSAPIIAGLPQTNAGGPVSASTVPSGAASPTVAPVSAVPVASAAPVSTALPASITPAATATPVAGGTMAPSSIAAAAPAVAPSTAASAAASSGQAPSVTTTPGSVALIQTGAGNIVVPGTFSASSTGTIVQNTLNDQKIQNITVVNATVNSMQILKALNLQAAISSAINDSVRK